MAGYLEVKTTIGSQEEAELLARGVVEARLAACVQVSGPINSTYWWNDKIEDAAEWICTIKTTTARYGALESFLKANHGYETPEIIATVVSEGSAEYLEWLDRETTT